MNRGEPLAIEFADPDTFEGNDGSNWCGELLGLLAPQRESHRGLRVIYDNELALLRL